MTIFFIAVFAAYGLFVLWLAWGWTETPDVHASPTDTIRVTVIVPFRNEAEHLYRLVSSLLKQEYDYTLWEVVLVNDHSTDQFRQALAPFLNERIRLIDLPLDRGGKKAAITFGVQSSQSDIIVTTDADCEVLPSWLSTLTSPFRENKVMMVTGPVSMRGNGGWFSKMQVLEFSSLTGSTASLIQWRLPTMCNGANLAFRRQVFLEVKGYEGNEHVFSGDDEFLMRKVVKKWPYSVVFCKSKSAIVHTEVQRSIREFISQRIRWAGKWKENDSIVSKAVAVAVFCFHILFLSALVAAAIGALRGYLFFTLLASKLLVEVIFLLPVVHFLGQRWRWTVFLLLQVLHPIYVVVIAILSRFKKVSWKGRVQKVFV